MKGPLILLLSVLLVVAPLVSKADMRRLGSVEFNACGIGGKKRPDTVDAYCTHFDVAENPAEPGGRRVSLNVALVPARSPKPSKDLLVFLAGGPGQAAVEAFELIAPAFQYLLKNHNLLLVDQRGTGGSNRLDCPDVDYTDAAQQTVAAYRRQAEDCLAAVKAHADPRFYTTTDAIRDLETLRVALGNPQYDLIGGSYGTRVALSYLQSHPDSLRSIILDGVVPQDEPLGQSHARNLDDGLARIFSACTADPPCAKRFGDPAATLAGLRTSLRSKPVKVEVRDPVSFETRTETLDEITLAVIVRLYSYEPESAALLPLLIDEAAKGRPQALITQGLIVTHDLGDQLAHGMELSVICAEDAPELVSRPEDDARLIGNQLPVLIKAQCPVWPTGERPAGFKTPVMSGKPVLLLSGEWDPVTPPRFAEAAARTLDNSRSLVAKGRGHIVMTRGCMPKIAAKFVETLKPAELDVSCLDAFGNTPAFISFQGPPP